MCAYVHALMYMIGNAPTECFPDLGGLEIRRSAFLNDRGFAFVKRSVGFGSHAAPVHV